MTVPSRTRCRCCRARVRQVVVVQDTNHLRPPCTQSLNSNHINSWVHFSFVLYPSKYCIIEIIFFNNQFWGQITISSVFMCLLIINCERNFYRQTLPAEQRPKRYDWLWRRCARQAYRSCSSRRSPSTAVARVSSLTRA